ncbi:MAG: 5-oxoprolinase subunit PxpB, partial [Thermoanaerobaculia bacterium]
MKEPSLTPLGDRCVTVSIGEGISVELSQNVMKYANAIKAAGIHGVTDVVASYASIGVFYEPLVLSFDDIVPELRSITQTADSADLDSAEESRLIRIPVRYDGEDIDEVARRTKMSSSDIADLHSSREYHVFVVGFVPGWAYLGPLDPRLIIPRRESPRKKVPPGSVAIAENQTGVYPATTPGGWHLIGSTTEIMFDAKRDQPALL